MTGKFLIDLTDERFLIAVNTDVMDFVRRTSPSAHSDVGSVLLDLRKSNPAARAYSPSYASCAYVVLHTEADRIFGIAFGQRGLAFRFSESSYAAACTDGGQPAPDIGPSWVSFAPFGSRRPSGTEQGLDHWCARALADALSAPS